MFEKNESVQQGRLKTDRKFIADCTKKRVANSFYGRTIFKIVSPTVERFFKSFHLCPEINFRAES